MTTNNLNPKIQLTISSFKSKYGKIKVKKHRD